MKSKVGREQKVIDIVGIVMPLIMAAISFVTIFSTKNLYILAVMAFYLSIFFLKCFSFCYKEYKEKHGQYSDSSLKLLLLVNPLVLILVYFVFIMSMLYIVYWRENNIFGHSFWLAIAYGLYAVVKLAMLLTDLLKKEKLKNPYYMTTKYLGWITGLFSLVNCVNNFTGYFDVLENRWLSLELVALTAGTTFFFCILMLVEYCKCKKTTS